MTNSFWTHVLCSSIAITGVSALSLDCAVVDGKVPLGINLGLTHITAACLNTSQIPVPVTRMEPSTQYLAYIQDAFDYENFKVVWDGEYHITVGDELVLAPVDDHDNKGIMSIIASCLSNITEAARTIIGVPVSVGVVTVPEHFNETSLNSVYKAALDVDDSIAGDWIIRKVFRMIGYDYSPEYCTRQPDELDAEDWIDYIFVVNLAMDMVEIMAGRITSYIPELLGRTVVPYIEFPNISYDDWPHRHAVSEALTGLIREHLAIRGDVPELWDPIEHLQAIILAGDASPYAVSLLTSVINATMPDSLGMLQTHYPEYRAALGAACDEFLMRNYPPHGMHCASMIDKQISDDVLESWANVTADELQFWLQEDYVGNASL